MLKESRVWDNSKRKMPIGSSGLCFDELKFFENFVISPSMPLFFKLVDEMLC